MLIETTNRNFSKRAVMEDEGVPSKAIWDPSLSVSLSSASSLASTEDSINSANERLEGIEVFDADPPPLAFVPPISPPAAFALAIESLPSAASSERDLDLRMKIYEEDTSRRSGREEENRTARRGGREEENPMAANFRKTISNTHGSSSAQNSNCTSNATAKSEMKNQMFETDRDGRQKFIDSMGNLSDKQLRIQLWDSFRLARVILGEPVKDKRRLSHKSILLSIRKVAELKMQNISMLKELDGYRMQKRKQNRQKKTKRREKQRQMSQSPDQTNEGFQQRLEPDQEEDVLEEDPTEKTEKPLGSPFRLPSPKPSPTSSSDSLGTPPSEDAVANLRDEAIKVLQAEHDLATSELQEMKQKKRDKKKARAEIAAASPSLIVSPSSSSSEEDAFSYGSIESPAEILNSFRGADSQHRVVDRDPESTVDEGPKPVAIRGLEGEIRRVLDGVIGLEREQQQQTGDEPEITTTGSLSVSCLSISAMHKDVISLLSRLLGIAVPCGVVDAPEAEAQPIPVVVPRTIGDEISDGDDEGEHPETASVQAQIAAAREREKDAIENLIHYKLQMEMMTNDVEVAKKNTTKNREKLQLERLEGYKKELDDLLEEELQRAKHVDDLDEELDELASVCVKLEDRENDFQAKHRKHQTALTEFRAISKKHSDRFRSLMGSIDRGIREQSVTVFGKSANDFSDDAPPPPPPQSDRDAAGGFPTESAKERRIQHLEHLLTKQNVELMRYRTKFKARGGRTKKLTSMIKWSSSRSSSDCE
mmetsp:Transcript_7878/g.19554  ORF Transcript_7878/g.19554 Transcript_7878/m.19554 type:complete len:764 (+) Transcript_7878:216-2507(+)